MLRLLTMAANAENAEIARAVIGAHPIDVMDMKQMAVFGQIHGAFLARLPQFTLLLPEFLPQATG